MTGFMLLLNIWLRVFFLRSVLIELNLLYLDQLLISSMHQTTEAIICVLTYLSCENYSEVLKQWHDHYSFLYSVFCNSPQTSKIDTRISTKVQQVFNK